MKIREISVKKSQIMNCIFCKIIAGEIPCYKLAENDTAVAFLDIMPVSRGHFLVVPKKHVEFAQ